MPRYTDYYVLPKLTNPAGTGHIVDGREAIDQDGNKITGAMGDSAWDAAESHVLLGKKFGKTGGATGTGTFNYNTWSETLNPVDDSRVHQDTPDTTHDDMGLWIKRQDGNEAYTLLEFILSRVPVGIINATLRLYITNKGGAFGGMRLDVDHDDFDETTVTWNNQPVIESPYVKVIESTSPPAVGNYWEFDVKHYIIHQIKVATTRVTFRLSAIGASSVDNWLELEDREGSMGTANYPELVIDYLYALS